jgi:hypothetical protein
MNSALPSGSFLESRLTERSHRIDPSGTTRRREHGGNRDSQQ